MFVFGKFGVLFFLKHSFWDSPFCLITDKMQNKTRNSFHRANILFSDNNRNETNEYHFKEIYKNLKMLKCTKMVSCWGSLVAFPIVLGNTVEIIVSFFRHILHNIGAKVESTDHINIFWLPPQPWHNLRKTSINRNRKYKGSRWKTVWRLHKPISTCL